MRVPARPGRSPAGKSPARAVSWPAGPTSPHPDLVQAAGMRSTPSASVGPGYGVVTLEAWEALDLLATTEGTLLDPVYTAKAMAGLIDDARRGRLADGPVVLIHTGGLPAAFTYRDELMDFRPPPVE